MYKFMQMYAGLSVKAIAVLSGLNCSVTEVLSTFIYGCVYSMVASIYFGPSSTGRSAVAVQQPYTYL